MNTRLALFCLVSMLMGTAQAQTTPSAPDLKPLPYAPEAAVRALYHKTLSDLGAITLIRIQVASASTRPPQPETDSSPKQAQHTLVWRIIENSELRDYKSISVTSFIPPQFTVEYANGTKVHADRFTAAVIFPDGTVANYILLPRKE